MGKERQLLRRQESREAGEDVDLSVGPNLASSKAFAEEAFIHPDPSEGLAGRILQGGPFPTGQRRTESSHRSRIGEAANWGIS